MKIRNMWSYIYIGSMVTVVHCRGGKEEEEEEEERGKEGGRET